MCGQTLLFIVIANCVLLTRKCSFLRVASVIGLYQECIACNSGIEASTKNAILNYHCIRLTWLSSVKFNFRFCNCIYHDLCLCCNLVVFICNSTRHWYSDPARAENLFHFHSWNSFIHSPRVTTLSNLKIKMRQISQWLQGCCMVSNLFHRSVTKSRVTEVGVLRGQIVLRRKTLYISVHCSAMGGLMELHGWAGRARLSDTWLAVWCSGNALVSINAVALHRARLVLGWVTAFGQVNCLIT